MNGTHAVISIPVMNDEETAKRALLWEKQFLDFIQNWIKTDALVNITDLDNAKWAEVKLKVAFTAERSVEAELYKCIENFEN